MFMQHLRKSMKIFFWFIAIVFILFIFFDFGTTLTKRGVTEKGYIAKVDRRYITLNEFNKTYQNTINNIKKHNLGPYEQRQISDDVLDRIIINKVLEKFLTERKIRIDEKLANDLVLSLPPYEIVNDTNFYENGIFKKEKYIELVKDPKFSPFFENYKRYFIKEMPYRIMNTELLEFVRLTNSEIIQKILEDEVKIKVEYLYFKPDTLSSISISEEEAKEFFKENYHLYKDIRCILSYTFFPVDIYEEDKKNTKEFAENIVSMVKAGIPFDTLISEYSDSIYNYKIEDIKNYDLKEQKILKSMKINDTKIIENNEGILIYYLKEKDKERYGTQKIFLKFKPSYENVLVLKNKIDDFINNYKEDSINAVKLYNVDFKRFYYRRYSENPIKIEYPFLLDNLNEGEFFTQLSENGYYLVKIDKNFKNVIKYEDVMDLVKEDLKKTKIINECLKRALSIHSKIKDRLDLFKNESEYGITDYISINSVSEPFIKKGVVIGAMFNLKKGSISTPIVDENGVFIIKVLDRKEPDIEQVKSRFETYYTNLYDTKRKMVIDEWYRKIIDNAKIKDYRNFFNL